MNRDEPRTETRLVETFDPVTYERCFEVREVEVPAEAEDEDSKAVTDARSCRPNAASGELLRVDGRA